MTGQRVVFMGTPDFAVPCLEAIVAAGYEVCGVVSQPDRPKVAARNFARRRSSRRLCKWGLR